MYYGTGHIENCETPTLNRSLWSLGSLLHSGGSAEPSNPSTRGPYWTMEDGMFTGNTKTVEGKKVVDKNGLLRRTRPSRWAEHQCDGCGLKHWLGWGKHSFLVSGKRKNHFCSHQCEELHQSGEKSPMWKGGRNICGDYVHLYVPNPKGWGRGYYALEHRVVMEKKIGRKLSPTESVHHKNGITTDNRPENLELWEGKHRAGQRKSDLLIAIEMLMGENESLKNKVAELEALLNKKSRSKLKDIKNDVKEEWGVLDMEPVPSQSPS